jgi:hypothetical protein
MFFSGCDILNPQLAKGGENMKYDIAAFIWPSYTGFEPRTRFYFLEGYGEWQILLVLTNKGYEGCRWPRIPTW